MTFGFVYLLDNGERYKIGSTIHLQKRIRQLNTGSHVRLKLVHSIFSARFREIERKLHSTFSSKRGSGEWFNLCEYDVDYIKSLNCLGNSPEEQVKADRKKAVRIASYGL